MQSSISSSMQNPSSAWRPRLLMAATSGKCWQQLLLGEILGKEKEAAVAAASRPARRDVVIDFDRCDPALEAVTEEADSALHVVAAAGNSVRYLDSASVICGRARHLLTAQNSKGDTPLHCAARAGNARMVRHLIDLAGGEGVAASRAFVRMQNARGETALHEAVRFANMDMVEALMGKDGKLARVVANDGTSPLYLACSLGDHNMATKLHNKDGELSYSGPDGQNALHVAVLHNQKITSLLLKWNKDLVGQRDIYGNTPMHFAASGADPSLQFTNFVFTQSNFERYSFFVSYYLPQGMVTRFYEWRQLPLPQLLEADPSSAFQPDIHGSLPVHVAASADSMVSIIVLLTRYPGCAGLRDAKGRTFLHVAVEKKRIHVVEFVCHCCRSFTSVLNVQDNDGNTALHLAILEGELDIFRCLLGNSHVHINLQNNEGKTPMDLAQGKVKSGFYFGLTAPRRILGMLMFANSRTANRRRDQMEEYNQLPTSEDDEAESKKITQFAQIVGIGSVLVATATFAAALNMPGGVRPPPPPPDQTVAPPAGTPVLASSYEFDGFVISNTLAFMCSTLATFSLVYCGVAAVDIHKRLGLVSFSLALLLCAARSFCAAFAFALYMLLADVEHGTAIASCVMTSLALLDGIWFLLTSFRDTTNLLRRRKITETMLKIGTGFLANIIYLFWPYLIIFGYLFLNPR